MKKYNITVNGKTYEVDVEEIGGAPGVVKEAASAAPSAPAAAPPAPAAGSAPAAPAATASAPSAGAAVTNSPMPGTILDVLKQPGDAVEENDVVLILEAMKMENEIVAPKSGTIDAISVVKGAAVNAGDVLFSVK